MRLGTIPSRPAQRELDIYKAALERTPEFLVALGDYSVEVVEDELEKWLLKSRFRHGRYGYEFPDRCDTGEQVSGSITPIRNEKDEVGQKFNYSHVQYSCTAPNGMMLIFSLDNTGSHGGMLWLGECNNSAAHHWETPQEAWAAWVARRAVVEF